MLHVRGFECADNCYLGDAIGLTLSNGSTVVGKDILTLDSELTVAYGQINGLVSNFYSNYNPISHDSNDIEQAIHFTHAYNTLTARHVSRLVEAVRLSAFYNGWSAVNNPLDHHHDPLVAYNSLPDETSTFQRIARINFYHFGSNAHTAYNVGHSM